MATAEDIIFEPSYTPNRNWVKELDPRHMDSTLSSFLAPKNDKRVITLCRPFAVLTKNSYSSPVTLPLGLAYLGGVLEKANYNTKIIIRSSAINEDSRQSSNAGKYDSFTKKGSNCNFCDFDQICSENRIDLWECKSKSDPALQEYISINQKITE